MENEKEIGRKAAKMLEANLKQVTNPLSKRTNEYSIADGKIKPRYRNSVLKNNTKKSYLKGLSLDMPRHGFIYHYGIDKGRARKGSVKNSKKRNEYRVKPHFYKNGQEAVPFLKKIKINDVERYLLEKLSEIRGEEILLRIKKELENEINNQ